MNERMTIRAADGQAVMDCQKCKAAWTGKHGEPMDDCTALYCRNRLKNRLAEYEDTGLTPKLAREVAEFAVWVHENGMDKIREWVKAEEEKRLVVLPCKVDDTVYRLQYVEPTPYRFVLGIVEIKFALIWLEELGKTVFLTREEAEKALKEGDQK